MKCDRSVLTSDCTGMPSVSLFCLKRLDLHGANRSEFTRRIVLSGKQDVFSSGNKGTNKGIPF